MLDHADHKAPTRQNGLDHTDRTDHTDQEECETIYPEKSSRIIGSRLSVRSEVCENV